MDALTAQLTDDERDTLVIVQSLRPDRFFTAAQQALDRLMPSLAQCACSGAQPASR